MTATVLFVALLVFLILNVPVGIAIGLSALSAVLVNPRMTESFVVSQLIAGSDSFPLMAIPLFILAGELMAAGGVSKRILNVCNVFLGRITGGLAIRRGVYVLRRRVRLRSGDRGGSWQHGRSHHVGKRLRKELHACLCSLRGLHRRYHSSEYPDGHLRNVYRHLGFNDVPCRLHARYSDRPRSLLTLLLVLQENGLEGR